MRTLVIAAVFGTMLLGTTAFAQDKPASQVQCNQGGKGQCKGQGKHKGQNFVDSNKDGVCDHKADGTGPMRKRDGSCMKKDAAPAPVKK